MSKVRSSSSTAKKKMISLNYLAQKLQKRLSLVRPSRSSSSSSNDTNSVPNDVKEGHFAVIAADGSGESTRFVVPLSCLSHPTFRRLLELAAEEFGFNREGALTVPCGPGELRRILADHQQWNESSGTDEESSWPGFGNDMVQSY